MKVPGDSIPEKSLVDGTGEGELIITVIILPIY